MADIYINDTLSKEKKLFIPVKPGEVSIYNCGPTVYDYAHIGNFRTFITADLLRRVFEYNDLKVNQVMNITDVDDKTIKRSQSNGTSLETLTRQYEDLFFKDLESLNILHPTKTPRATDNIKEMISLIEKLLEKGVAYKSTDGVYFDITKSEGYGKLANLKLENTTKERVANDEYDKENARDFSLWKFYSEEDGDVVYEAPFGKGRPGWHIECSAMSINELGETLDVHTGGSDLIFPHHTNEIAQSEAVTGKKFVNYWVHGGFITVDGKKMSKSLGNIFTLKDLKDRNISPLAYRYLVLQSHYSGILNFTWEALEGAQTGLKRLKNELEGLMTRKGISNLAKDTMELESTETELKPYKDRFIEYINDDMNTAKVLALITEIRNDSKLHDKSKKDLILDFDRVLGLQLDKIENFKIPDEVQNLIKERDEARANKDFTKSDELRSKIEEFGFEVKDTGDGTVVSPK